MTYTIKINLLSIVFLANGRQFKLSIEAKEMLSDYL